MSILNMPWVDIIMDISLVIYDNRNHFLLFPTVVWFLHCWVHVSKSFFHLVQSIHVANVWFILLVLPLILKNIQFMLTKLRKSQKKYWITSLNYLPSLHVIGLDLLSMGEKSFGWLISCVLTSMLMGGNFTFWYPANLFHLFFWNFWKIRLLTMRLLITAW